MLLKNTTINELMQVGAKKNKQQQQQKLFEKKNPIK